MNEIVEEMISSGLGMFNPYHNTHICSFSVQTRCEIRSLQ